MIHVTQAWLEWQHRILLDTPSPDDITMTRFRESAVRATQGECAYMSALTGILLRASFPKRFTSMMLLRSKIPTDTDTGREEAKEWKFDTWLMLIDTDGTHIGCSPTLHMAPTGLPLVEVCVADTSEGLLEQIADKRKGWEWPPDGIVQRFRHVYDTSVEGFYTFDEEAACHAVTTLTWDIDTRGIHAPDPRQLGFAAFNKYA